MYILTYLFSSSCLGLGLFSGYFSSKLQISLYIYAGYLLGILGTGSFDIRLASARTLLPSNARLREQSSKSTQPNDQTSDFPVYP